MSQTGGSAAAIRTAARVARYGYQNRGKFKKAAITFQKMYRGRQSRRSTAAANKARGVAAGIGSSMTTPNNKKFESLQGGPTNLDSRTLYVNDLTAIPKTTISDINGRDRHFANVKGFSINWHLANRQENPLLVNIACIAGRGQKVPTTSGFFRDYTSSRDVDFSTSLNSNEIHTYPISTDKYRVLWSHRHQISGLGNSTGNSDASDNFKLGKTYVPLNRQIRYNDNSDDLGEERVYLVYWFDMFNTAAAGAVVTGAASVSIRTVTYFTDETKPY